MGSKLIYLIAITCLVMIFQNCSDVSFSPDDAHLAKVNANDAEDDLGDGDSDPAQPVSESEEEQEEEVEVEVDQNALNYICILDGPGKSVRLGYVKGALQAHGKTPDVVCMSRDACLKIVSRKFAVKEAARRGFCPHKNPHVVAMPDSVLDMMVGN